MKRHNSFVASAVAAAALIGFTTMPSIAGEPEELFLAYGCGRMLCSNSVEAVRDSGLTRTRFIKTDRYISNASITFAVVNGKRTITVDSLTIPIPGEPVSQHYVLEVTDDGPTTTWFPTGTDGEYDFFVIKDREALAYTPYPLWPVEQPASTIIAIGR